MLDVEPGVGGSGTELIRRCLEGDPSAFDGLVSSHYRGVYNMIYQMMGNPEDAADLTQETFVRAYTRLETFDLGRPFAAWVRRIASNLCIDTLRRRRNPTLSLDQQAEAGYEPVDTNPANSPSEQLEATEDALRVMAAVQQLPEKQRAVVVLRHIEGMTLEEIARCLRMPLGTVKVNLFRARQTVRELVGEL
jgi:RNA polymerase sigma-70 factor, ECF subfamily